MTPEPTRDDADLCLRLGRVYALAGKAGAANDTFEQGLRLAPGHPGLELALREMASLLP